jgi:L-aspartate oxidase
VLDLLILGSGVAGLSAAVRAADIGLRVGVMTKGEIDQATTRWAQGGVAAVLGDTPDSTDLHFEDTLAAGGGLCDPAAVRVLVDEGPVRVKELIDLGATFDRGADGRLALAREGGHSRARVVHAGGAATGLEVERALVAAVQDRAAALYERWFALDLIVVDGRAVGVRALPPGNGRPSGAPAPEPVEVRAEHVLIATGGAGQLYAVTTNPADATGDGIAMGLRAGALVADLEFIQFHPTALHHPVMPRPLLSEALRGHGAVLRARSGDRFVDELLPRDEVSRAISEQLASSGAEHVWLDCTGLVSFAERFPSIAASLAGAGLDPAVDWLPVAPAAHYTCGGLVADLDGAMSLPGLWVAGEAACNGVHGANRLASNSLLDGMVFGARVVEAIDSGKDRPEPAGVMGAALRGSDPVAVPLPPRPSTRSGGTPRELTQNQPPRKAGGEGSAGCSGGVAPSTGAEQARGDLQKVMTEHAGVVRSAESLRAAAEYLDGVPPLPATRAGWEVANLVAVGGALVGAALARPETRGAHTRSDHPRRVDELAHRRFVRSE